MTIILELLKRLFGEEKKMAQKKYILSTTDDYFSQNNNVLDSVNACPQTNMVQALYTFGFRDFPEGKYKQAEDNLYDFICNDKIVASYFFSMFPEEYNKWVNGNNFYSPNHYHKVLAFGTNQWIGRTVVEFVENFSINDLHKEIIERKRPIVMSGKFTNVKGATLNHIITLVGCEIKDSSLNKEEKDLTFFDIDYFIFNDTYGETYKYNGGSGYNVKIRPEKIIKDFKSLDNPLEKWCHIFKV